MRRLLIALSLVVLVVTGCGGDDSASDEGATDTVTDTETTEAAAPDQTADDGAGDADAFCAELEALTDIDPEELPTQADIDRVTAAVASAPPEIAEALTTIAAVGQLIADEGPEALTPEAVAELEAQITGPEVTAAGGTLVAFAADECDLDVPLFTSFTE